MADVDRELGNISARLDRLERDMMQTMSDTRYMKEQMDSAKGGWKMILFLIGISSTLGAIAAKVLPTLVSIR